MAQLPNENISLWIQVFAKAYISNPDGFDIPDNIFSENMNNDLPSFINICDQILLINNENDQNLNIAKQMSSYLLTKILDFQNTIELSKKRSIISLNIAEQIKNALKQTIFSENPIIRSQCIKSYSLLFSILTTNWSDGINDIVNSFNNMNLLPYGFIVLLSIMSNIVNSKIFLNEIFPSFSQQFTQVFVICMNILSKDKNEQLFIPQLRTEACKYICDFINLCPTILNEGENIGSKIPFLLQILPNSFQINDTNLYGKLVDLLFIIVDNFYSQSNNFMGTVATYIYNGFALIKTNAMFACFSIDFWSRVAQLEFQIIERSIYSNHPEKELKPHQPLLSEIAFKPLIQFFVNYSEIIDPNDAFVENVQRTGECKSFVKAISSIYLIVPSIFNILKPLIDDELAKEKWTNVYSGVVLLLSIANEPLNQEVGTFLINHLDFLISKIMPDQVPRLRYNSLLVIGLIITNYSHLIQQEIIDKIIQQLIGIFTITLKIDEEQQRRISKDNCLIFELYASLIFAMSSLWNNQEESNLRAYFNQFYQIISTLIKYGMINNFNNLIEKSSDALNRLVSFSTDDMLNNFGILYDNALNQLLQLNNGLIDESTCLSAVSCYCSNITTILLRLKTNDEIRELLISQCAERTIQVLFEIMQIKNENIWKESFWTIASLIIAANSSNKKIEIFTPYTSNILINRFVQTAFSSSDPDLIRASCCLISNLFLYLSKKITILNQLVPNLFSILVGLVTNVAMKNAHPFILEAIASIFLSFDENNALLNQFESPLRQLIIKIMNLSECLDIMNENEIEFDNLFYQYLCDVLRSYAKLFHDNKNVIFETEQLTLLQKIAAFILNFELKINEELFRSFMQVVRQFTENVSAQNKMMLNHASIMKMLSLGYESCSEIQLKEKIKEIADFLTCNSV